MIGVSLEKHRKASQLPVASGTQPISDSALVTSFPLNGIDAETIPNALGIHTLPLSKPQMRLSFRSGLPGE